MIDLAAMGKGELEMSCKEYGSIQLNNRFDLECKNSDSVWGVAFVVDSPWPQKACIQDYDASPTEKDGKRFIQMQVENGSAIYEVVERCEYGCANHCKLVQSEYRVAPAKAA